MRSILRGGFLLVGLMSITAVGTGQEAPPKPKYGKVEWSEGYPTHIFLPTGQRGELEGYLVAMAFATAEKGLQGQAQLPVNFGQKAACELHVLDRNGAINPTIHPLFPEKLSVNTYRTGRHVPGDPNSQPPTPSAALPWQGRRRTGEYGLTLLMHFSVPGDPLTSAPGGPARTKTVTVNLPAPPKQ